jgi:hypothetical protein
MFGVLHLRVRFRVLQVLQTLQSGLNEASTGCLSLARKAHTLIYDKILFLCLQNNVGMTEALVDDSGYPRQDVDVYQVRDACFYFNSFYT